MAEKNKSHLSDDIGNTQLWLTNEPIDHKSGIPKQYKYE